MAFRDASKFYIPLILIGGLLLSFTLSGLEKIIRNKKIWNIFILLIYGYLIILIYPAFLGNLRGVLGPQNVIQENDYQLITNNLNKDQSFFRSLYIEEKPAKFFGTYEKPVISGNTLYKERPFASMIIGKYDLYNFLHDQQLKNWFNLFNYSTFSWCRESVGKCSLPNRYCWRSFYWDFSCCGCRKDPH